MNRPVMLTRRLVQLFAGLIAYGVGLGLMVCAAVGIPPWDVLAQGLSKFTGLNFGTITVLVGVVVLILWIPLREKPGIGTVLNVLVLGPVAQLVIWVVPDTESLFIRIPLFILGILCVALGTGLYIGPQFGPGPRDGLMTGLHRVFAIPVWVARTGIEVSVLLIGWILGGDVGFGTLAFALFIGPLSGPSMRWFDLRQKILDKIAERDRGTHQGDSSSTIEAC